jgi:hypothetical protein
MERLKSRMRAAGKRPGSAGPRSAGGSAGSDAGAGGSGGGDAPPPPPPPAGPGAAAGDAAAAAATAPAPAVWAAEELAGLGADAEFGVAAPPLAYDIRFSAFNPTPGACGDRDRGDSGGALLRADALSPPPSPHPSPARHGAHRLPAGAPQQLPLLRPRRALHAHGAGRRRPAVRWAARGRRGRSGGGGAPAAGGAAVPGRRRHRPLHLQQPPMHSLTPPSPRAEWLPMYAPTKEQAEQDRRAAYEAGVPHGRLSHGPRRRCLAPAAWHARKARGCAPLRSPARAALHFRALPPPITGYVAPGKRPQGEPTITLTVVSDLVRTGGGLVGAGGARADRGLAGSWPASKQAHACAAGRLGQTHPGAGPLPTRLAAPAPPPQHDASEYGTAVGPDGRHSGGPFAVAVSPKMRIEELRLVIRVGRWGPGGAGADGRRRRASGVGYRGLQQPGCEGAARSASPRPRPTPRCTLAPPPPGRRRRAARAVPAVVRRQAPRRRAAHPGALRGGLLARQVPALAAAHPAA